MISAGFKTEIFSHPFLSLVLGCLGDDIELKDTVSFMISDDYRDRIKAEYYQLVMRIDKLKKYVDSCTGDTSIHKKQLQAMTDYLGSLCVRMVSEGVSVSKEQKQMLFD